ncbi:DnaK suppressor protein [Mariprofundus micogutta]|uniref:DnaK suppressor protein n=1 Tax=Mariprofundus micogutta TaxID=1921010 RepID=A0A1L8CKL9_9PROT|nr:RNA polymerase-binding protein DksA [Mariprofundus micogutta]GAV19452.1 DnaK suppressor protein [Mariprofundus micogutta]
MALTKKQLEEFDTQLTDWKAELEVGQSENVQAMTEQEQTSFPDPTDQASMETDRNFDLRIKDRERRLIKKIDQALQRIKDGEFGECDSCGGDISVKRLQARPVTTLCIECKTAQEQEERTRSDD